MTARRALPAIILLLLVVGVVAALIVASDGSDSKAVEGRLEVSGAVNLKRGNQETAIDGRRNLEAGDAITVDSGSATLVLPAGGDVEARKDVHLSVNRGPELVSGTVLVVAEVSTVALRAGGSNVYVAPNSAARVTAGVGLQVDVFAGSAEIASAGRSLQVPSLRSVHVPAVGLLPGRPSPLVMTPSDPWDQRYLAAAIDASQPLEDLARGFSAQVPSATVSTVGFYQQLLPGLAEQSGFGEASIGNRPPGETLVAAAIALLGQRDNFEARYANALSFRADGAQWALVALDQQVASLPALVERVRQAAGQQPVALASVPQATPKRSTPRAVQPATAPTAVAPAPAASSTPSGQALGARTTTTTTVPGIGGLLSPVLNPILNLLGGLLAPIVTVNNGP